MLLVHYCSWVVVGIFEYLFAFDTVSAVLPSARLNVCFSYGTVLEEIERLRRKVNGALSCVMDVVVAIHLVLVCIAQLLPAHKCILH